jgi:hypothetical protein
VTDQPQPKFRFPTITSAHLAAMSCLALAAIASIVAPGATAFGADEAALLGKALLANRAEVAAANGLVGTFGVAYGPVPTWIYQYLLALTHDPVTLVSLRASLFLLTLGAAMLSLARSLRLSPWIAPVALALPWVWWHARLPWDNSFLIPFAAITLASLARFVKAGSPVALVLTIVGCGAMLSTHLMSLPVVSAVVLCLLVTCRRQLLSQLPVAICSVGLVLGSHWMYLARLIRGTGASGVAAGAAPIANPDLPGLGASFLFPFSGELLAGASPLLSVHGLAWVGSFAIVAGAAMTIRKLLSARESGSDALHDAFHQAPPRQRGAVLRESLALAKPLDVERVVPMVAIMALLMSAVFFAITRPGLHGHYLHAVFVPALLLAALAWQAIPSAPIRVSLGSAYLAAMLAITGTLAFKSAGATTVGIATPTLATLDAIANDLHNTNAKTVRTTEPFLQRHPAVLRTLIALKSDTNDNDTPGAPGADDRIVRFRDATPDAQEPPARRINLTGPIDLPQYDARALATVGE